MVPPTKDFHTVIAVTSKRPLPDLNTILAQLALRLAMSGYKFTMKGNEESGEGKIKWWKK